jgi:hypothetical protein
MNNTILSNMINNNKSIDEIQEYLSDNIKSKNDLEYFRNKLDEWSKLYDIDLDLYKINEKWLITIILLYKFPDELNLSIDTILFNKIGEFIKYFKNNEYPENFNKILITLKIVYDEWRKNDWHINMRSLIELYLQYDYLIATFNNKNGDDICNMWILFKDELLNLIKKLSPSKYEYNINKYRSYIENSNNLFVNEKIKKKVEDYIKNEYWTNIKNEYNSSIDNDKYEILEEIIYEYTNLQKNLHELLETNVPLLKIDEINENNIIWSFIENIKKYDCPMMDLVYDNIYLRWVNNNYRDFINIVRFLYQRLEIIILLINKKKNDI